MPFARICGTMALSTASTTAAIGTSSSRTSSRPRGGTGRLLLVEDEPRVRAPAHRLLEKCGYTVVDAVDGADGLPCCEERRAEIDVVVTDVMMHACRLRGSEGGASEVNSGMSCPPPEESGDRPEDEPHDAPHDAPHDEAGRGDGGMNGADADEQSAEPRGPFTRDNPLTFIVPEPLLLRIERVDRPGAAPGEQPVAFSRAGPREVLLAVNAYPAQLVDAFFASDAFGEPVIVVGAAWEENGGVRGELSTLLPERTMRAIQESVSPDDDDEEHAEPWAASASLTGTSYEEVVGSDEDEDDEDDDDEDDGDEDEDVEPHFPLVIGAVLRFPENRKFPLDFELEVDDLMRAILEGRAMDAGEKRIDNLLGGI